MKTPFPQQWHVASGWSAVLFLDDSHDQRHVEQMLPDEVGRLPPTMVDGDTSDPVVGFADLAKCAEVARRFDVERTIFLVSPSELESHADFLVEYPIRALLDRSLLVSSNLAACMVNCILGEPWSFDVDCLQAADVVSRQIGSSRDRDDFISEIVERFEQGAVEEREAAALRLVVEELTTNALIHAFDEHDGIRYEPSGFASMRSGDLVHVDYRLSDGDFFLKVVDSAGSLDPKTVRNRLHRQISGNGLLDTNGRGLFLGFTIATLLAVNVDPGRMTELVMVYERERSSRGSALLINRK